ncbi:hypothetical protein VTH06DRAFT_4856 [Thermothelomyces fergusii]
MKAFGSSLLAAALLGMPAPSVSKMARGLTSFTPPKFSSYSRSEHAGAVLAPPGTGGVCYSIAVPASSASAGSGNIYFQIQAPTSLQWVALGTGSSMSGSNIFLMYQDGRGNVTLSPRLGRGHSEPKLDTSATAARLTLLAGSGVSEDGSAMTANVACANCESWDGGEMSLQSSGSAWIGAWRQGPSLATTDPAAAIDRHDGNTRFQVDLTEATVSADSNPFVSAGGDDGGDGSEPGTGPGGGSTEVRGSSKPAALVAHGIVMALVMGLFYPLGSTIMPLAGKWWVHAAWQTVAFCLMWAGFGLGVVSGRRSFGKDLWDETHTVFGAAVVGLLAIQPLLGYLHHLHYLSFQRRGLVSYVHIWWGRILMGLGVVNGGLGLKLAREADGPVIAYSVISGVVFLGYLGYKLCRFFRLGTSHTHKTASDGPAAARVVL